MPHLYGLCGKHRDTELQGVLENVPQSSKRAAFSRQKEAQSLDCSTLQDGALRYSGHQSAALLAGEKRCTCRHVFKCHCGAFVAFFLTRTVRRTTPSKCTVHEQTRGVNKNIRTVLALSIRGSINSRNCFFRGFGDLNFVKKAAACGYHTYMYVYCTVWTTMLGEAMLQVACGSSSLQNKIFQS